MEFVVKEHRPRRRATSGGKASRPRPRGGKSEDAGNVTRRQTRRKLSDFAGILSPEAVQEIREAIDAGRTERGLLDRERLKRLLKGFSRSDDSAVLETARRKAKAAGLTRKKAGELLHQVKREMWNRTYGDKKQGIDVTGERRRSRPSETDFLDTPMYRLVDRHRAILEKIRTREDAEYWGHMLIGEFYPDIPHSRSASGKLAALVGLTDYVDFYCAGDYYDLLKEGKTLEEARRILVERRDRGFKEFMRILGSKKGGKRVSRSRVVAKRRT